MRKSHYLPKNKANQMPQNCIWVDTETKGTVGTDGREYQHLWFGWAVHQRTTGRGNWTAPDWKYFVSSEDFWNWAEDKTRKQTRLYIFAHNWAFDGPVLNLWTSLHERGWELKSAVADAPPIILTYRKTRS